MTEPLRVTQVPRLPPRAPDGHKGTYGRSLLVAGSPGMAGAAALAGMACLRGGAGLVFIACPEPVASLIASFEPSYQTLILPADSEGRLTPAALESLRRHRSVDAMAIGPGLAQSDGLAELVAGLLTSIDAPMVIDADGLNLLARDVSLLARRPAPTVLTPHVGEFSSLTRAPIESIQARREEAAVAFARDRRVVVVLKGPGTIVTDGTRVFVNTTGNPGMATGGSGDVLTGLTTALLGQGMAPLDAAILAVHAHGMAGDLARDELGEISLCARDLVDHLPAALKAIHLSKP